MKRGKILLVDDERSVRESLKMILKDDYELSVFSQGEEVLKEFRQDVTDVALLDIKMPGMSGMELLKRLKEIDEDLEVIMITGYGDLDSATEAMRRGASAYINKPFDKNVLLEIIKERVKRREKRRGEKRRLLEFKNIKKSLDKRTQDFYASTIDSLLAAIHAKDGYTSAHSEKVARYALLILEACNPLIKLTPEEKNTFRYVASLHDIGKIGVPESILSKKGKLNAQEWKQIKKHPEIGCSIVTPISKLRDYMCIIRHHHEKYNGTGYPDGKRGDEIPLFAHIVAIADAYHAMRSERPYRKAMSKRETLRNLKEGRGTHFHPQILDIAMKVLENCDD
jgi:putative two-component system response regulator